MQRTIAIKDLDAVVAGVGDIGLVPRTNHNPLRRQELALAGAHYSYYFSKPSNVVKQLNAVVAGVGDGKPTPANFNRTRGA